MATRQVRRAARSSLGLDELRPGQADAVEAVVAGRDTLLVMPTGWGKSAVYQIAGAMLPGPTVVVSPLIALQQDQVDSIAATDAGLAAAANSTLGARERRWVLDELRGGGLEFLFVAPEQLSNEETRAALQHARPSLFVVDEAHCISEWGHDFRPDYLRLAAAVADVGRPPVLALTATASPVVRDEIVGRLGLDDPVVIVQGFDRPNLRLEVRSHVEDRHKVADLVGTVATIDGPGIVYVATRAAAEEVAALLAGETGRSVGHYHGGMRAADRREVQDAFMEGEVEVMVATSAFGMGIDKADVRYVIHLHVPESVDAYYQEVGRAGRDGEPALALLLWRPEDLGLRRFFAGAGQIGTEELERVATLLRAAPPAVDRADLAERADMSAGRLQLVLARLEAVGAVTVDAGGAVHVPDGGPSPPEAARAAGTAQDVRQQVETTRLEMMRGYAESRTCRRRFVLTYFGEAAPERCGNCDVCDRADTGASSADDGAPVPWPEQSRVVHVEWGAGQVLRRDGDAVVVLFDEAGYRTLSAELVAAGDLLRPAD